MERLFWHLIAGVLSIFLAVKFVPGVNLVLSGESVYFGILFDQEWKMFLLIGGILGIINFFVKPILDIITLPLKVLTLGIFSLILNIAMVWALDVIFKELEIIGLVPLLFTTVIVWAVNFFLGVKK